jgi:hypothetical protein
VPAKEFDGAPVSKLLAPHFESPASGNDPRHAIAMCVASRRAFAAPGPCRLEAFMNRDPRWALSQELEAKQTLLDQLRALAGNDPDFVTDLPRRRDQPSRTSSRRSTPRSPTTKSSSIPAQAPAEGATRERFERIGGHGALIIDWLDAAPLDAVPLGQLADRIVAFLRERREDHQALLLWRERNRHALRGFWARTPADALGVKREFEKALAQDGMPPK